MLSSLSWGVCFSLISDRTAATVNGDLLMSHCLVFIAKFLYILAPPLLLQGSPSELSEKLSPGLKSSESLSNTI